MQVTRNSYILNIMIKNRIISTVRATMRTIMRMSNSCLSRSERNFDLSSRAFLTWASLLRLLSRNSFTISFNWMTVSWSSSISSLFGSMHEDYFLFPIVILIRQCANCFFLGEALEEDLIFFSCEIDLPFNPCLAISPLSWGLRPS